MNHSKFPDSSYCCHHVLSIEKGLDLPAPCVREDRQWAKAVSAWVEHYRMRTAVMRQLPVVWIVAAVSVRKIYPGSADIGSVQKYDGVIMRHG